jgi:hypothetical protein
MDYSIRGGVVKDLGRAEDNHMTDPLPKRCGLGYDHPILR